MKKWGNNICECGHCGERFNGSSSGSCAMYCNDCKTAPQRAKIDAENGAIRSEHKPYCKRCNKNDGYPIPEDMKKIKKIVAIKTM